MLLISAGREDKRAIFSLPHIKTYCNLVLSIAYLKPCTFVLQME